MQIISQKLLRVMAAISAYDKFAKQYTQYSYSRLPQFELDSFISIISKKALILDVACGPGRDSEYFTNEGFKVIGIDLSKKLIAEAKKRVKSKKAKFKVMDLEKIKLKKNSFDGIWCYNSSVHIDRKNIAKVLKRFFDLLKKDGVLFIDILEGKEDKVVKSIEVGNMPRKFSFFGQVETETMMKDIGFYITSITPVRVDNFTWINIFAKKLS